MPVNGLGWEVHFIRRAVQTKPGSSRKRTVGDYQIYHDGTPQAGGDMSGMFAEREGPGNNTPTGIGKKRIEEGRYPLYTQNGTKYVTYGYVHSNMTNVLPRPSIELKDTGARTEILIHPAGSFLWSIGCINLCTNLPDGSEPITYTSSRRRVISMIEDMKAYHGGDFPPVNGKLIPNSWAVIDGEP